MTLQKLKEILAKGNLNERDYASKIMNFINDSNVYSIMEDVSPTILADMRTECYIAPTNEEEWSRKITCTGFDPDYGLWGKEIHSFIDAYDREYRLGVESVRYFLSN